MKKSVKLTTRGRYAIMAIVELASHENTKPTPLAGIANKCGISLSYLEQLIAALRKHNLVKSYRGPGGGYVLTKSHEEIMVSNILLAAEDSTPARRNETKRKNKRMPCAPTDTLWEHIGELLYESLKDLSLQDIMNDGQALNLYKKIENAA